ncbi:uncharacterized protein LOC123466245 [Daphnia magna]|uniref:uncharacterized protein LOC123466245 n=1 Tax=Daphnia magna TaxID=35525 RepID=UPI001401E3FD|nr:uncharacterized protein LOC123466245 [Daphnia magna]
MMKIYALTSVMALGEWVKKQPHLQAKSLDAKFLLRCLRGCKYSMEKTKKKLDLTLTLRIALPEFFRDGIRCLLKIKRLKISLGGTLLLPGYDRQSRNVVIIRPD